MGGHLGLNRSGDHRDKSRQAEVVGAAHCPWLRVSWRVISGWRLWLRGFRSSKRSSKHRFIDLQVGFTWGKLRCPKEQGPPRRGGRGRWRGWRWGWWRGRRRRWQLLG
jgi:hypothetical protein